MPEAELIMGALAVEQELKLFHHHVLGVFFLRHCDVDYVSAVLAFWYLFLLNQLGILAPSVSHALRLIQY